MAEKKAAKTKKKSTTASEKKRRTSKKDKDKSMEATEETVVTAQKESRSSTARPKRKATRSKEPRKAGSKSAASKAAAAIEKSDDQIVIRFPPAAPPPFLALGSDNGKAAPAVESKKEVVKEKSAPEIAPIAREAEVREPRRSDERSNRADSRRDGQHRGRDSRRGPRQDEKENRDEGRGNRDDSRRGRTDDRGPRTDDRPGRNQESDNRRTERDSRSDNRGNRAEESDSRSDKRDGRPNDRDGRGRSRRDRNRDGGNRSRDDQRDRGPRTAPHDEQTRDDHASKFVDEPAAEERTEEVRDDAERDSRAPRSRRGRRRRGGRRQFQEMDVAGPGRDVDEGMDDDDVFNADDDDTESVTLHAAPRPDPDDNEFYGRRRRRNERTPREEVEIDEEDIAEDANVKKTMVINVVPRDECRIGLLSNGKLEEIFIERASSENYVGNIYKGIVTNVEPSIQAAFIDFGIGKNGFLHISDLHPEYFGNGKQRENVGRKTPRRRRPPIQECVRKGQEVIVQITKEGIGTKGPTLTTYLSIPGRFVVMMPGMEQLGVSRKIEDEDLRRKVRQKLNALELTPNIGFIGRTAALGQSVEELQADVNYLTRLWKAVEKRRKQNRAPAELYREADLVIRTIRDAFTANVTSIVVDDPDVAARAEEFLSIFNPDAAELVTVYKSQEPIFHHFGIEDELERLHSRNVPLESGGSLVIDQTEALVAIDVNSGKFRTEDDAELTAFKMNMEAADEIPRQLRLRDLGGVVICDFIDMRDPGHRREIERRLVRNLKVHKERAKILRMSSFGIIEMTRQRQRASLTRNVYQECNYCRGTGLVKSAESVALDVMRLIQLSVTKDPVQRVEAIVSLEVAALLLNRKRALLNELETTHRRTIVIHPEPKYGLDHVELRCTDNRGRLIPHS